MQRQSTPAQHEEQATPAKLNLNLISGVFTGSICTGVMSPWDRAMYLAVRNDRKLWTIANFEHPYQGFTQAVTTRAIFGGIYYVAQGQIRDNVYPYLRKDLQLNEVLANSSIGLSAGAINGVITNFASTIKYHTWGKEVAGNFFGNAKEMWHGGGAKTFVKGTKATVARDMVFGTTYEVLRHLAYSNDKDTQKQPALQFASNCSAAAVANVLSGPLNYARTIQYATPPSQKPESISTILRNTWQASKDAPSKIGFWQRRLQFGWGTVRVAVGMALGQALFNVVHENISAASKKM